MKLKKQYQGCYKGEVNIDNYHVKLEVNSIDGKGFSFTYYVNDKIVFADGWYGLRLKDIKDGIENDILRCIEDYKNNDY
jgi:hypothetical protein